MEHHTIGVDIGGTEVKIGLVDDRLQLVEQHAISTRAVRGPAAVVEDVAAVIRPWCQRLKPGPLGIGVGCPGPLSPSRGLIHRSANLPGWVNVPLRDLIAERTSLNVVLDNDAKVAAYGEYRTRPAGEQADLVLITLGTGVGVGVVMAGRLVHGHFENAAELGHMIVQPGGRLCNCGQRGCLEMYASAANVAQRVIEALHDGERSSLKSAGGEVSSITAADVARAAQGGDDLCAKLWDEACYYLAMACVNLQHAFNPRRILLGGGMSNAGDFLLVGVQRHFAALRWRVFDDFPDLEIARLGNQAGMIGAAALALDTFEGVARG